MIFPRGRTTCEKHRKADGDGSFASEFPAKHFLPDLKPPQKKFMRYATSSSTIISVKAITQQTLQDEDGRSVYESQGRGYPQPNARSVGEKEIAEPPFSTKPP